ncbi:MAG: hypothetical protein VX085_16000, partial [Pseudomonadota bacterium]|nr:hypothetical protein [Pseudomonadota bacterium]
RIKIYYMKFIFFIAIINSIGTIFHDFIHYIFGLILGARPTRFSLLPKATESGYVLGSVSFAGLRGWQAPPVALAPLVLLPVAYLIEQYFFSYVPFNLATYFAYVFTLVVTIENALPSIADIKVATSSPLSLFLWMMAIIGTGAAFLRVTGAWGIL